ncbi:MAG: CehA/McbA family metallohydrolase [Planctomycetota bacterium]|jgi:hypothetical protein
MNREARALITILAIVALPAPAAVAMPLHEPDEPAVAGTAAADVPAGVLAFEIRDHATDEPIAGRLTLVGPDGPGAALFPNTAADPERLAVRDDVVYTLLGAARITVPAGTYAVHASRGLEWSTDSTTITIEPGVERTWTARLSHELDTSGWVSGDFHLHTLTFSGHGDADLPERIISIVGEGLEFAVATDHNHHTDYRPTIESLGASAHVATVTGNEVSTPIGHFNAFPLHPGTRAIEHRLRDATALFQLMREHGSPFGIDPVIQVNHPRWGSIDYFGQTGLDPVTGQPTLPTYSDGFDAIEVLNENAGWGYYDAEVDDVHVGAGRHWVLQDWYNLLNRGHRAAAVGNSDSHTVRANLAGFPRNFVRSDTDDPAAIDPVAIAEAIRRGAVFTTTGPFVEYTVQGRPEGSDVVATDGSVTLGVRVQAASWVDVDRVNVVLDGDVAKTIDVPATRHPVRLETTVDVPVVRDGWLTLLVEGDESLAPIVPDKGRPVRPLAVSNPVWIDADGRPGWTSPHEAARQAALAADAVGQLDALPPARRALVVLAAADGGAAARPLIARGLEDPSRRVRLCAARAAAATDDRGFVPGLEALMADPAGDAYQAITALRALAALEPHRRTERLVALLDRFGGEPLQRHGDELAPLLPGAFITDWLVAGYFPNENATGLDAAWGPEDHGDRTAVFGGKRGQPVGWRAARARPDGFLSLLELHVDEAMAEDAVAFAQTWLHAPSARRVHYTLGTDDGCRVELNGAVIHEDRTRHGATPMQHVDTMDLRAGWNRVVVAVENGVGSFGLYFRVLDDQVRPSAER